MSLTELLHDEIDAKEELIEEGRAKLDELRSEVTAIAAQLGSVEDIFEALAVKASNMLAEETTKAVRLGFDAARKRNGSV